MRLFYPPHYLLVQGGNIVIVDPTYNTKTKLIYNGISFQKLLFSWGPGSVGEQLAKGTGIKVERGHFILLQARVH